MKSAPNLAQGWVGLARASQTPMAMSQSGSLGPEREAYDVPDNFAGALADRYQIERELGRGGMATVYLASDLKHGRAVAIKVLSIDVAAAIGTERFQREIEIAARLSHPHIVPLHDSGVAGDRLYYVMPYIEGESLRARIDREQMLPLEDALRLVSEIASALGYAHHRGLVHRDIKPENVLLSDGLAMVTDFGIARVMSTEAGTALTKVGMTLGTPAYMSPEQITGESEIDGRADLYSLGCLLYEMLTGSPPFKGPWESLAYKHVSVPPQLVTEVRPGVPQHVVEAIAKVLAKRPTDRFDTAGHFIEALASSAAIASTLPLATRATKRAIPNTLPRERTRFIGREQELAECADLFVTTRLLTLTGLGGSGKTRLVVKLAEKLADGYPDGVYFADLAPLTEGIRVAETVAQLLGVREEAGSDLFDPLCKHISGKQLLLVLDNCEHLLSACAMLADTLLNASSEIRILATSQEGLGIDGERLFALRSLRVPSPDAALDVKEIAAAEAVKLFLDRAQIADQSFTLTEGNAVAVVEICRRLDGIPLAIELAAARVKILSVEQIRTKLDDRFRLLTGGSRTALPRHQTLRAAIQWSYDQLANEEQRLLRLLSVFAGGWTLNLVTQLTGDRADEFEVMDLLKRLVDKSLVLVEIGSDSQARYGLLETVRHYSLERLIEAGEADTVRKRHLDVFLNLAERAYTERIVREQEWAAVLEREIDNFRAALEVGRELDPEQYLQLSGALAWFWLVRSHLREGQDHLMAALAASSALPPRASRARALWGAAYTLLLQGDAAAALPWMEQALGMWREVGDVHEVALALEGIGWTQFLGGNDEPARATFEECLRLQRERGDPHLINRAMVALAQALVALHRVEEARPMASEIITFSKAHGDRRSEHFGWHYLADCALIEDKCEESLGLYQQSLVLAKEIGDRLETGFEVQGVAMSLAGLGDSEQALRLAGAAKAEWERIGAEAHIRFWDALLDHYLGAARHALGSEAADRAWNAGRSLSFDEAVSLALKASGSLTLKFESQL